MIIEHLISTEFPILKLQDTVQIALISMEEMGVLNLPVLEGETMLGYVKSVDLEALDPQTLLSEVDIFKAPSLNPDASLFHALQNFADSKLDLVAVCNKTIYQGSVWMKDVVYELGRSVTTQNEGSVLILRCLTKDYSISELGRIIESGDGKMLGLWAWQASGNRSLKLMIKLNIQQIDNVVLLLRDHGYEILQTINNHESELTRERYQSLLKYLDI